MKRKALIFSVLVLFVMCLVPQLSQADGNKGGGGYHDKGLDDKILFKAKFMLKNQDELGLSKEQVAKIKEVKIAVKKDIVKRDAEIELLKIDIMAKMYEDKIDVAGIDKLIDKKYDLKKAKAKALVQTCADLRDILTEDQMKEFKTMCRKSCKK
jgi:protein CpxP